MLRPCGMRTCNNGLVVGSTSIVEANCFCDEVLHVPTVPCHTDGQLQGTDG
jgi:hypothetical protein